MFEIIPDFEQQAKVVFCSRKKVGDLGSLRVFFLGLVKSPRIETLGSTRHTGHSGIPQEKLANTDIPSPKLTKY